MLKNPIKAKVVNDFLGKDPSGRPLDMIEQCSTEKFRIHLPIKQPQQTHHKLNRSVEVSKRCCALTDLKYTSLFFALERYNTDTHLRYFTM